ncbi:MAG: cupin domain-containing protein [Clostridiales bacterium]|nr:cupin domain-containing protein [Clostridiales bacterium]
MQPINIDSITDRQVLVRTDKYKMICFVFEAGKGLPNHTHNGLAAIQIISGLVDMSFTDGTQYTLNTNDVLGFDASVEHNVIAKEPSKVIVTIIL